MIYKIIKKTLLSLLPVSDIRNYFYKSFYIFGTNNNIKGYISKKINLSMWGNNNTVIFGANTKRFTGTIHIGTKDCPVDNCNLQIGDNSSANKINIFLLEDNSNVIIGKDCMFSSGISIFCSDTHSIIQNNKLIYNTKDNFVLYDTDYKNNLAVIYFSSNGLWNLDQPETFISNIVEQDKYEFMKIHVQKAERQIFVRDVFINWYFSGINKHINTIEKLRDKLIELTWGYKVVTMGVSGGGYIAMLMGAYLNAEYVLSFSGQIDVLKFAQNVNYHFPFCNIKNAIYKKYLNIQNILNENPVCIFNFVATKNVADKENIELSLQTKCIHTFQMSTNKHGMPISKKFLMYYLNLNKEDWLNIYKKVGNKIISPVKLDIISMSLFNMLKFYLRYKFRKFWYK